MAQRNVNVVLSANNGGGSIESSKTPWFRIGGQGIATDGDPVSSHPPCPTDPVHCSPDTANGHDGFLVGGHPVILNGDRDTCGHFRRSTLNWFKIDDAL